MSGIFGIFKFIVSSMGVIATSLMLSVANAKDGTDYKSTNYWDITVPPEDISVNGHLIDWLFNYTTYMNLFFFILVCAGLFGFAFIYHHKKNKKPLYTYGNKPVHIWTVTIIGVAVFIGIDATISAISNNDLRNVFLNWPKEEEKPLKVQVMAQQWVWKFRYAGKDEVFNTQDDVVTVNDLRVPINRKLLFQVTSKDVIHSFFLPNARRKVDAMPGRISRIWMELNKAGKWPIACAEMCGTHHYMMGAKLTTYTPEDFESWLGQAQRVAMEVNDPEDLNLYWGWKWEVR